MSLYDRLTDIKYISYNIFEGEYMGNFVFIPDSNNEFFLGNHMKGEIHYKFNDALYKTLKPVVEKINKLCILVISKNKLAVGLQYIYGETPALYYY
jgi:hypothetical protein